MIAWFLSWVSFLFINVPLTRKEREIFFRLFLDFQRPVLVTGGSGMVGTALKKLRPGWVYVDSKKYGSLTDINNVRKMFDDVRPRCVVHLAANVGGILKNMNFPLKMFEDNILMNTHILGEAARRDVWRVVNVLSTCIFPDGIEYPLEPEDLHEGPPHYSNEGYAYTKRMSEVHSRIISKNTRTQVTCLVPTNIYGPNDNFSLWEGHVIPALIHRAWIARRDNRPLEVLGSGEARRQFIHADDLALMIVKAIETRKKLDPLIMCCDSEEYSIAEVARLVARDLDIEFVPGPDGQLRKTAVPHPDFQTSIRLTDGIRETVEWFKQNKRVART